MRLQRNRASCMLPCYPGLSGPQPARHITGGVFPMRFTLERVTDENIFLSTWHPLLTSIFTDPADLEPCDLLRHRLRDTQRNTFSLLRDSAGQAVGLQLTQRAPSLPGAAYIPWCGLAESVRNNGLYPKMAERAMQEMRRSGTCYMFDDFENPARIHIPYGEQPGGAVSCKAAGRLNFFRRTQKARIIDDADIPYLRPASNDPQKIMDYSLLSISFLDENNPVLASFYSADGTRLRTSAYRRFYLEVTRLQYGDRPESALRDEFPAVDKFLSILDHSTKKWVNVISTPIRPRARPEIPSVIE